MTQVIPCNVSTPSRSALPVQSDLAMLDIGLPVLAVASEAVHLLALRTSAQTHLRYSPNELEHCDVN